LVRKKEGGGPEKREILTDWTEPRIEVHGWKQFREDF